MRETKGERKYFDEGVNYMSETLWAAVFSVLGSLIGTLGGILASARLTNYRITQLENKMNEVEKLVKRIYQLEQKSAIHEEQIKAAVYNRTHCEQMPN